MGIINIGMFVIFTWLNSPVVLSFNCTFETGFCNWTQNNSKVLQWKLFEVGASTDSIIPPGDHTTGNGSFVYVNASTNGTIKLKSEKLKKGQYCLSFWYFMVGPKANAIKVYRTNKTITIFSTYGSQGRLWKEAKVYMFPGQDFQILIEAKFNSKSGSGFIGVDDVSISTERCPLDCTFDNGFCAWKVTSTSKRVKWTRKRYDQTSLNFTYVSSDQDYYLNVDKKGDSDTGIATIFSSWQKSVPKCFTFQVYLFGTMVNVLNVYLLRYKDKEHLILSINNTYDKILHQEYIDINHTVSSEYRIKISANVTSGTDGNVLIDNITSTDCLYGCESSPCENGATCKNGIHGNYTCVCSESWSGHTCNESLTTTTVEAATRTSSTPAAVSTRKQTPIVYIITPVVVVIVITVAGIVVFLFRRKRRQQKDDGDDQEFVSHECIETGVNNHEYALTRVSRDIPAENNYNPLNHAANADYATSGEDDPSINKLKDTDNLVNEDTDEATTLTKYSSSPLYENTVDASVIKGLSPENVIESEVTSEESSYDTLSTALVKNVGTSGAEKGEGNEYDTFAKCRSAESGEDQDEQMLDDPYDHISYNSKTNDKTLHDDEEYSHIT